MIGVTADSCSGAIRDWQMMACFGALEPQGMLIPLDRCTPTKNTSKQGRRHWQIKIAVPSTGGDDDPFEGDRRCWLSVHAKCLLISTLEEAYERVKR